MDLDFKRYFETSDLKKCAETTVNFNCDEDVNFSDPELSLNELMKFVLMLPLQHYLRTKHMRMRGIRKREVTS